MCGRSYSKPPTVDCTSFPPASVADASSAFPAGEGKGVPAEARPASVAKGVVSVVGGQSRRYEVSHLLSKEVVVVLKQQSRGNHFYLLTILCRCISFFFSWSA